MLKDYLEQRHISLASGRSSIALEREYWKALETLAYEDGWHNWIISSTEISYPTNQTICTR